MANIIQTKNVEKDIHQVELFLSQITSDLSKNIFSNPDIHTINLSLDDTLINIDAVRELKHWYNTKPIFLPFKFCIIANPENMTTNAANACLKILEDYKHNKYFILISNNCNAIIKTIVSRCKIIVSNTPYTPDILKGYDEFIDTITKKDVSKLSNMYVKDTSVKLEVFIATIFNKLVKYQFNMDIKFNQTEHKIIDVLAEHQIIKNIQTCQQLLEICRKRSGLDHDNVSCMLIKNLSL